MAAELAGVVVGFAVKGTRLACRVETDPPMQCMQFVRMDRPLTGVKQAL